MTEEKNCKWYFVKEAENHQKQGFQGLDELFKQAGTNIEWSFSREILQNCIDARLDETKPVHVKFSYGVISNGSFPEFFKLSEHVDACGSGKNDKNICEKINGVLENTTGNISYMRVSDYNTIGLKNGAIRKIIYSSGDGRDADDEGKGGAYGYGHNAYICMSAIRCFLVSSHDEDDVWTFGGLAVLKSHVYEGFNVSSYGYYTSDDEGYEVKGYENIPASFRRSKDEGFGTDVFVMGCKNNEEEKKNIIEAILANFWLAILQKKLTVEIDNVQINDETIDELLQEYFNDKTSPKKNPLPAYKAVKNILKGEGNYDTNKYRYFESPELDGIGKIKLYFNINKEDSPNRHIEYMRIPMMLVTSASLGRNIPYNFSALMLCDNKKGDTILRRMESPTHNEWAIKNVRINNEKELCKNALCNIKDFIISKVEEIFCSDNVDTIYIDLGSLLNPFFVNKTSDITSKSGKEKAKVKEQKKKVKVKVSKTIVSRAFKDVKGVGIGTKGGSNITGRGHAKINRHGGNPTAGEGSSFSDVDTTGKGRIGTPIDVTYDVVAVNIKNQLWHRIIIMPDDTYDNCFIYLGIGTDVSNNDKDVVISRAFNGKNELPVDGSKIKNIPFVKGQNIIIDVLLSDNIKHSIIIRPLKDE